MGIVHSIRHVTAWLRSDLPICASCYFGRQAVFYIPTHRDCCSTSTDPDIIVLPYCIHCVKGLQQRYIAITVHYIDRLPHYIIIIGSLQCATINSSSISAYRVPQWIAIYPYPMVYRSMNLRCERDPAESIALLIGSTFTRPLLVIQDETFTVYRVKSLHGQCCSFSVRATCFVEEIWCHFAAARDNAGNQCWTPLVSQDI